jgi:hypothetical protein
VIIRIPYPKYTPPHRELHDVREMTKLAGKIPEAAAASTGAINKRAPPKVPPKPKAR